MTNTHKLVLIGDSAFAEIAYEYFTWDSPYEVVAFAVEREFRKRDEFQGLPVIDFEELPKIYSPSPNITSSTPSPTANAIDFALPSIRPPKLSATLLPPTSAAAHSSGAT